MVAIISLLGKAILVIMVMNMSGNGQYDESEAKPRRSIKESLKENKEKVSEEKKERKVKRQKRTERE